MTGDPRCGKTTALRRVVERLRGHVRMTGFWTEEVLENGARTGFRGVTLDGRTFRLAQVGLASPFCVGPYGVDVEGLESVAVPSLTPGPGADLVVLDEVGKMESFSEPFQRAVERLLDGPTPLLGTVAGQGVGFPKRVRQDRRVEIVRMSRDGRSAVVGEVLRRLARAGIGREDGRESSAEDIAQAVELVSEVKHEVNNLLMGLLGHAALLRESAELPEPLRERVAMIERLGRTLRDRIADLDAIRQIGQKKQ